MPFAASTLMTFVLTAGPVIIDLPGYNVRDCAPPLRDSSGTWHLYATVINASKGTPGYFGEVGHFTATGDNVTALAKPWSYQGIVIERGSEPDAWDSTGAYTPGVVFDGGRWTLFFAGVGKNFPNHKGSDFSQYLGMATSESPYGPFVKSPDNPIIRSAVGPPPLASNVKCNLTEAPAGTNFRGSDLFSVPLETEEECAARCCGTEQCRAYTFTTFQDNAKPNAACSVGKPCCWIKHGTGERELKDNCSSASVDAPAPNGSWPFIRVGNPLPLIAADGTRMLLTKGVDENMTALINVYLPNGGSANSFDAPYVERPGNPITRPSPDFPEGFENQVVMRGPDGLLHMFGNNHGKPGNPHLVSDPSGALVDWHEVELLHGLGEPAPVAAGVPGAGASEPLGLIRFGEYGQGRLTVRFETIEWRPLSS